MTTDDRGLHEILADYPLLGEHDDDDLYDELLAWATRHGEAVCEACCQTLQDHPDANGVRYLEAMTLPEPRA